MYQFACPPTAAVLAQHLVVLIDPADIGGVTVHPAQCVTTLTVVLSPRTGEPSPESPAAPGWIRLD